MTESPLNVTLISGDDFLRFLDEVEIKTGKVIGMVSVMMGFILLATIVFTINAVHTIVEEKKKKKQKTTLVISLDVEPKKKKETKKQRKQREAQKKEAKCVHGPMFAESSKTMMFPVDLAAPLPKSKGSSFQEPLSYGSSSTLSTTHLGNTPQSKTPEMKTPTKSNEK